MEIKDLIDYAESNDLNLTIMDGFNDCIVGITNDEPPKVVYSEEKVLECLAKVLGDYEDALDYYGYNISSTYIGEQTPLIIRTSV